MVQNPQTVREMQQMRVLSMGQEILRRRKWQPTPVLLPGESHGQRSLVGYSPWGHKESDTTEQLNNNKILPFSFNRKWNPILRF